MCEVRLFSQLVGQAGANQGTDNLKTQAQSQTKRSPPAGQLTTEQAAKSPSALQEEEAKAKALADQTKANQTQAAESTALLPEEKQALPANEPN